jgi:hypothetical protein
VCPLCGAPLALDQEWCLRCGAAARTRLAAAPNWRAPVAALIVVAALALGALAAALVKLAGDSGQTPAPSTRIVTTTTPSLPGTATGGLSPLAPGAGSTTTPTTPTTSTPGLPGSTTGTGSLGPGSGATGSSGTSTTRAGKGRLRELERIRLKLAVK